MDVAEEMLQSRGFNAFSYADVAREVGIRKASIHYYFASKGDLGVALVRRYRERFDRWVNKIEQKGLTPEEKLAAYFQIFGDIVCAGKKICMNGILSAEFNALPESVQKELKRLMNDQHLFLKNVLEEGRKAGVFRAGDTVDHQAVWIGAAIQGGVQIARTFNNPALFETVVQQIRAAIVK